MKNGQESLKHWKEYGIQIFINRLLICTIVQELPFYIDYTHRSSVKRHYRYVSYTWTVGRTGTPNNGFIHVSKSQVYFTKIFKMSLLRLALFDFKIFVMIQMNIIKQFMLFRLTNNDSYLKLTF